MPPPSHCGGRTELSALIAEARRHLELEQAFGVESVRVLRRDPVARKRAALERLQQQAESCRLCELGERRNKLVFGAGDPNAGIMFIGEAPGQQEDMQGIPFVGRAGQLLTRIIHAIGLKRDEVHIGNVLKCRPPGNRNPAPDETAACLPHLFRQIEIIRPRIIVTLGNPATKALLQTTQGITRMRGKFADWHGIEVMPTFHPSYLLRNPAARKEVWEDMQKVYARAKAMGLRMGELKKGRG